MRKYLTCIYALLLTPSVFLAQGSAFGIKGGLSVANQNFNDGSAYNNGLLLAYHGDVYIENNPEDNTSVLYAQAGYHVRGHARRFQRGVAETAGGNLVEVPGFTQRFAFNNAVLGVGFKKRNVLGRENAYYTLGMRGEYTVSTSLPNAGSSIYSLFFLTKDFVRKINYGLSLGGGLEFPFSELVGGFVELNVHPDISRQYFQPPLNISFTDPFGQRYNGFPEQTSRNLTLEITLGLRFLKKVIYTD
jgi:hypothetical protein